MNPSHSSLNHMISMGCRFCCKSTRIFLGFGRMKRVLGLQIVETSQVPRLQAVKTSNQNLFKRGRKRQVDSSHLVCKEKEAWYMWAHKEISWMCKRSQWRMTNDVSSVVEKINSLESLGFDILNCSIKREHKINVELTKKLSPSQSTT